MTSHTIVDDLLAQLLAHRRRLQLLLTQQGKAGARVDLLADIADARQNIARLKDDLRQHGHHADAHPNDCDPDDADVQRQRAHARAARLRALCPSHADFIANRLDSFVGRAAECATLHQRIAELQPTGGYLTITGQAGQGKSSIIARLVTDYGAHVVAHHFIPLTPGPDHQVGLLRDLMAQLLLKHDLPEQYVAAESRPALRDYFASLLRILAERSQQEVMFIDGLDQLQEDLSGVRDLSFLPVTLPPGMVLVLGTRPNDTLTPLEVLAPHQEYALPNLSRADFDLILQHRGVALPAALADRFYTAMQENALYLDLVAREICVAGVAQVEALIAQVAHNPSNLFSIAIERLKGQRQNWREVLKPTLGVLLAAQSPLVLRAIRVLIDQDEEAVRDGLQRLGGLVARDGTGGYTLYHLKFRAYLRQDREQPTKGYVFADDEEEGYHQRFVAWCKGGKGGLASIWRDLPTDATEQVRRVYAREHFITHLVAAKQWADLWAVIDEGAYSRAKLRYDPSTRGVVQDLDRVRQAVLIAAQELDESAGISFPRLWRYSLLRCRLASQANEHPDELFTALALVQRAQEAIGLAELLTDTARKSRVLCAIGIAMNTLTPPADGRAVLTRAIEVARTIENVEKRAACLVDIAQALAEAQQTERVAALCDEALVLARPFEDSADQAGVLSAVADVLAEAGQMEAAIACCDEARPHICAISELSERAEVLLLVARAMGKAGQTDAAVAYCDEAIALARTLEQRGWRIEPLCMATKMLAQVGQTDKALACCDEARTLAQSIEHLSSDILSEVVEAMAQMGQWDEAIALARTIEQPLAHACVLIKVAEALRRAGQTAAASACCDEAAISARAIEQSKKRASVLSAVAGALAGAGQTAAAIACCNEAATLARTIELPSARDHALSSIAGKLANDGQIDEAATLARTIERPSERAIVLNTAGQVQEAIACWDEAAALVRTTEKPGARDHALRSIVSALAQAGQIDAATALARAIEQPLERAMSLMRIVSALAQAGQIDAATTLAHTIDQPYERDSALSSIVSALAQAGQIDAATTLAHTIEQPSERAKALNVAGQVQEAIVCWGKATTLARTIEHPQARDHALGNIVSALAQAGQIDEATTLARTIEESWRRDHALINIVSALAQAGQIDAATALAHTIEQSSARSYALSSIVSALAQAGQIDAATTLARTIDQPDHRASALTEVAKALIQAGQVQAALILVNTIDSSRNDTYMFSSVAQALARVGEIDAATAIAYKLEKLSPFAYKLEKLSPRTKALCAVAQALERADDPPRLHAFVHQCWAQAIDHAELWSLLPIAGRAILADPALLPALLGGEQWVERILRDAPDSPTSV